MSSSPALNQNRYRVRTDTGAVTGTPTWAAAEDTNASIAVETPFRIRFQITNPGAAAGAGPQIIRVSKNGGAYTAVTTSTGATLGAQANDSSTSADETVIAIGDKLLTGTVADSGVYDETGSATKSIAATGTCELEYGLILKTAGAAAGDSFGFRLYNSTTAYTTYTQTASVTVPEVSGTIFAPKYTPTLAGVGGQEYLLAGHTSYNPGTCVRSGAISDLHVVCYSVDNVATADGDESAVTSITDTSGNTYTKAAEYTKSGGALQGGVTTGIWYSQLTSPLTQGSSSLTLNLSSGANRDSIVVSSRFFTVAAGLTVSVEATNTAVATATATIPSLNATTSNIECLRVRAGGCEANALQLWNTNHTSNWTAWGQYLANSGTSATSIGQCIESIITTGTGAASSPAASATAGDQAHVYVAFKAALPNHACLANDVSSGSSVSQPAVTEGPPAAIFRSIANTTYAERINTTVTKPSGLAVGDFMLWAQITAGVGGGPDPTFPAGWTEIASAGYPLTPGAGGFQADFRIAYKFADSSDAAASNFTATHINCSSQGAIACWAGVHATTPLDTTPTQNFWNSGIADSTALSLTTVTNGAGIVIWGMDWGDTANNLSPPTGTTPTFTERLDVSILHMFEGVLATAGATGDKTFANNANVNAPWACYMLALRPAVFVPTDACLANDVLSASSVQQGANLKQVHGTLANDVKSNSSVSQPAAVIRRDLLANDVTSNSSVSVPTAVHIIPPVALLANDVKSNSSVSQPAAVIRRDVLANDVKSNPSVGQPAVHAVHALAANDVLSGSSVTQPAAIVGKTVLANDIVSASSVGQPAAGIQRAILANDVTSASSVTGPVLGILGQTDARDVTSTSNVSQPALQSLHGLLANDVTATSNVTTPLVAQRQVLDAVNVVSPSSVTTPVAGEIAAGQPLANDIVSASFVSTPTLVVEGGEVIPPEPVPLPPIGGAGAGGGAYPKAWQQEFDRRRAREEGLTLRRYLDQVETSARKGSASDRTAIEKSAIAVRQTLEREEFQAGLAEVAALERVLAAAAKVEATALLVTEMQAAELAANAMMQEALALEEQRLQAELLARQFYDDQLAAILLLAS